MCSMSSIWNSLLSQCISSLTGLGIAPCFVEICVESQIFDLNTTGAAHDFYGIISVHQLLLPSTGIPHRKSIRGQWVLIGVTEGKGAQSWKIRKWGVDEVTWTGC